MLKADLHMHSKYSMDCSLSLEKIIERCREVGVNCIALCDHGTAEGALKLREIAPFKVIVAEEVLTPYGEIMGMFLEETIPSGLSVPETIARIRAQDGLVCIPHPFDTFRESALKSHVLEEIVDQIDIIEVFNARSILRRDTKKAKAFAAKHGLARSAGSDAHTLREIGHAYVEMPDFEGKNDFLEALQKGEITGHRSNPFTHFASLCNRIQSKLSSK
ncbi:MAG: PHP-associated domain-containing protein [Dehalococcoidia bacterium]